MTKYAILQNPGHNRVYFESSKTLALVELETAAEFVSSPVANIALEQICGVDYFTFESKTELSTDDLELLSRLSFCYAIFQIESGGKFMPLKRTSSYYFGDELSTILKYSGKTNELFTRFMLNITWMTHRRLNPPQDEYLLLDPLCGKGTSLFEGLIAGFNVCGADIDKKAIHEAHIYLKKYLETAKYKHSIHIETISGKDKSFRAEGIKFTLAKSKADTKTGKVLECKLVSGDSRFCDFYFKRSSVDFIVGDLPYGVQHGSKSADSPGSFTRNPKQFIESCIPAWLRVLKPNGVLCLSWNNFVLRHDEMERIMQSNGLCVIPQMRPVEHRVDQAINRDMIIAAVQK